MKDGEMFTRLELTLLLVMVALTAAGQVVEFARGKASGRSAVGWVALGAICSVIFFALVDIG